MSKFALEALSDTLRRELHGIRVIVVEPGAIATPIWDRGIATADALYAAMPPAAHERYGALVGGMRAQAATLGADGDPPEAVAAVIVSALRARRPRARYVVGRRARVQGVLSRVLPDRALDAVLARALRGIVEQSR
jgi:NAD(P)-dependent dehydrogenase (short-subunit alcohol dehydrogenase family)